MQVECLANPEVMLGSANRLAADRHRSKLGVARHSEIDGRTTRYPGYAVSQRIRKLIEGVFGWTKSAAGMRQTNFRGLQRVGYAFSLGAAAYNTQSL